MRIYCLALRALLCAGCAGNRPPEILPLAAQTAYVGVPFELMVKASDPDGDPVRWSFNCATLKLDDRARLLSLGNEARFSWTPLASDAGVHTLELVADDGEDADREAVTLTVKTSTSAVTSPTFIKPLGEGTTLDLKTTPCLKLDVEVEDPDSVTVEITQKTTISGSSLTITGPQRSVFSWCPSTAQAAQQRHVLLLVADDHDNPPVTKSYTVLLHSNLSTNCPGAPPAIVHTPPGAQSTLADIPVSAEVKDDKGLKGNPMVYYSSTPPSNPASLDYASMSQVTMTATTGSTSYSASLPNPVKGQPTGTKKTLYYVIVAEDNDDATGNCDHRTQDPPSSTYTLVVTAPATQSCVSTATCPLGQVCDKSACLPDACTPQDTNGDKLYWEQGTCPSGHFCPAAGPTVAPSHCVLSCTKDAGCRSGEVCKVLDTKGGCYKAGYNVIGQVCLGFSACAGKAMCLPWPDGYCSISDCDSYGGFSGACPKGSACIPLKDTRFKTLGTHWVCLQECTSDSECRTGKGYKCQSLQNDKSGYSKVCAYH